MKKQKLKPLKILYKVVYYIVFAVAMVFVPIIFPIRVIGRKNRIRGGYILCSNHIQALDPMFVYLARGWQKKPITMAKDKLFEINPVLNFFWASAGAFPVYRGTGDTSAVAEAIEVTKAGRAMLLFPEGTRSKDGNLGRLKSGAFVIAQRAGVPIQPCFVWYKAGRAKPFCRCTVVFGKAVTAEELGLTKEYRPADLRVAKQKLAQILNDLYKESAGKL